VLDRLRTAYQRWHVRRRRRKLLAAYAEVGRRRHDLGPGLSSTLFAYDRVLSEGLAVIVDDFESGHELCWIWPEDDAVLEDHDSTAVLQREHQEVEAA